MSLDHMGWATLKDARARRTALRLKCGLKNTSVYRAALIVTARCNFACPYCQTLGGDRAPQMTLEQALNTVQPLINQGLQELRISGGEPTIVPWLPTLVSTVVKHGVRVAVSSNGYGPLRVYCALVDAGVSEFSISLDTLDPAEADRLAGGRTQVLSRVLSTVRYLAKERGVSVYLGTTCSASKLHEREPLKILELAESLGVQDLKIMTPAQEGGLLDMRWLQSTPDLERRFPFLAWRAQNYRDGRDVRGLCEGDTHKCPLVLDDVTIAGDKHYPCNVYFREGGAPIGSVTNDENVLQTRRAWYDQKDTHSDPICNKMCMDLLRAYNERVAEFENRSGGAFVKPRYDNTFAEGAADLERLL